MKDMIRELRHFTVPIIVALCGVAVAVLLAVLIFQVVTAGKPAARLLPEASDASAKTETPAVATVPEAKTVTTPQTESQTPTVATVKPQPKPTPSPAPTPSTPNPGITVFNGGCTITATGEPGLTLDVQVHSDRKGGQITETIPSSGTITVPVGGMYGMLIDARLITNSGTILVYAGDEITNTSGCLN
jgi:cytoskeletal protein RodZ